MCCTSSLNSAYKNLMQFISIQVNPLIGKYKKLFNGAGSPSTTCPLISSNGESVPVNSPSSTNSL